MLRRRSIELPPPTCLPRFDTTLTEGSNVTDKKVDLELERKLWLKHVRNEITRQHREACDRELHVKLPAAQKMWDDAVNSGKRIELDARKVPEGAE